MLACMFLISHYVCYKTLLIILLSCMLGKDVSDRWYNEVNQYNFKQPGFSSGTGKHALNEI